MRATWLVALLLSLLIVLPGGSLGSQSTFEQFILNFGDTHQIAFSDFHFHTSYSDAFLEQPLGITPQKAFEEYAEKEPGPKNTAISVFASLDHGGHLNPDEWALTKEAAEEFSRHNYGTMVALAGFEVTGTTVCQSRDPRDDWGFGHLGVLNSQSYWDARRWGDGEPPARVGRILSHYYFLSQEPDALGFICHPSLYDWTQPELLARLGAFPWRDQVIEQMVGCELSSHSAPVLPQKTGEASLQSFYEGLGDGITLATSNEACYRKLLQNGWRVGPMMSSDSHWGGYGSGKTVTGLLVPLGKVTRETVLDALRHRRFFATEAGHGYVILFARVKWQDAEKFYISGDVITNHTAAERISISIKGGVPRNSESKRIRAVLVFQDRIEEYESFQQVAQLFNDPIQERLQGIICLYAVLESNNGAVVSAPLWFD